MLHSTLVTVFGCANKFVVGQPELIPQTTEFGRDGGGKFRRGPSSQRGRPLDLLPVLVRAGQKPGINAQRPLPSRNGVAHNGGVGVPQVRPRVHIVDRRGQVIASWSGIVGYERVRLLSVPESQAIG